MLIKLEYSPYFIADDIKEAEGIKPLLADEALAFFRYILSVSNDPATIRFVCNSNSRGRKSIEVLYDLSDSFGAEFLSRTHSNRYFHFVPCDQCLVSGIDEVEFSRKLFFKTVGQAHANVRAHFTPKDHKMLETAYVVPFVHSAALSLPVQKWRQVISGLLQCDPGSNFSIKIWKYNNSQSDLQRFGLFIDNCIQLLSGIDPGDSLSSLFRDVREEQPLYLVRISVSAKDQHQRQLLQESVIAEFGSNNIILHNEQEETLYAYSIDSSLRTFLVNYSHFYSERELIDLILPPYSFSGPVSGMKSQIPKPFTLPDLEYESKYYSVCYQNEQPSEKLIPIGRINNAYQIGLFPKALTQHMFVSGTTGSGKTTFVKNVIRHLPENVHFLIIDPVKEEYLTFVDELHHQQLLKHQKPLLIKVNAYSTEGAIQINPFVVPDNCSVVEHIEFLTTVFASLMPTSVVGIDYISGMLKELYIHKFHKYYQSMNQPEDKWLDYYTRVFLYNSVESQKVFRKNPLCIPVLDDIGDIGLKWVEGITASGKSVSKNDIEILRYFQRWWNRLKDAHPIFCYLFGLKADHNNKGGYFKKCREFIDAIDQKNIVISLKKIRDPNEKKAVFLFFTGLLDSYRRGQDENDGELRHVTVLEEAHCIIPVSTRQLTEESAGTANTNANELISGMLSEIRAFGEGIIISEQSPSKIIPDAIINTSTKILKRTTYGPDLDRLAQAMGMSTRERDYLSHLMTAETIAFLPEESRPLYLVSPKSAK